MVLMVLGIPGCIAHRAWGKGLSSRIRWGEAPCHQYTPMGVGRSTREGDQASRKRLVFLSLDGLALVEA